MHPIYRTDVPYSPECAFYIFSQQIYNFITMDQLLALFYVIKLFIYIEYFKI